MRRAWASLLVFASAAAAETAGELAQADGKAREAWAAMPVTLAGRVVDEEGFGLAASVSVHGVKTTTDRRGWFRIENLPRRHALLRVESEGRFTELRVAELALPSREDASSAGTIVLRARRKGRARLVLGGDAMMGRRFLKPDNAEAPDALLREGSLEADAKAVLADVAPLLVCADFAIVNLESPVTGGEGTAVEKSFTFWTPPEALDALKWAGVDGVTLGNNHIGDYGEGGLKRTLEELDRRRLARCGAGADATSAARPADLGDFRIWSWSGVEAALAARMDEAEIRKAIAQRGTKAAIAAFHTGIEYSERPATRLRKAARAAADAGAALVVGHHAHTIQGLARDGDALVAWGLGNFVFDQTRWESAFGMLLVVDFEGGRVCAATVVPLFHDAYRPKPAAGDLARAIVRRLGAVSELPVFWSAGRGVVGFEEPHAFPVQRRAVAVAGEPLRLAHPSPAASLAAVSADAGAVEVGRDLLRIGGFEDGDTDREALEGDVWRLSESKRVSPAAARTGAAGLRVIRARGDRSAVASTRQRIPVPKRFTVTGWTRAENSGLFQVQADWCRDGEMTRFARATLLAAPGGTRAWTPFRVDVERPAEAFSLRLRLEVAGPGDGAGTVDVDDIAIVAWEPAKKLRAPNDWDWLRVTGASGQVPVTLEYEQLEESLPR